LPLQSSLMSETYLKSDHFVGGGSTFEQGDEKPWVADMKGTRETGTAFMEAVKTLCPSCGKTTQPYDTAKPTQPYKPTAKKSERDI